MDHVTETKATEDHTNAGRMGESSYDFLLDGLVSTTVESISTTNGDQWVTVRGLGGWTMTFVASAGCRFDDVEAPFGLTGSSILSIRVVVDADGLFLLVSTGVGVWRARAPRTSTVVANVYASVHQRTGVRSNASARALTWPSPMARGVALPKVLHFSDMCPPRAIVYVAIASHDRTSLDTVVTFGNRPPGFRFHTALGGAQMAIVFADGSALRVKLPESQTLEPKRYLHMLRAADEAESAHCTASEKRASAFADDLAARAYVGELIGQTLLDIVAEPCNLDREAKRAPATLTLRFRGAESPMVFVSRRRGQLECADIEPVIETFSANGIHRSHGKRPSRQQFLVRRDEWPSGEYLCDADCLSGRKPEANEWWNWTLKMGSGGRTIISARDRSRLVVTGFTDEMNEAVDGHAEGKSMKFIAALVAEDGHVVVETSLGTLRMHAVTTSLNWNKTASFDCFVFTEQHNYRRLPLVVGPTGPTAASGVAGPSTTEQQLLNVQGSAMPGQPSPPVILDGAMASVHDEQAMRDAERAHRDDGAAASDSSPDRFDVFDAMKHLGFEECTRVAMAAAARGVSGDLNRPISEEIRTFYEDLGRTANEKMEALRAKVGAPQGPQGTADGEQTSMNGAEAIGKAGAFGSAGAPPPLVGRNVGTGGGPVGLAGSSVFMRNVGTAAHARLLAGGYRLGVLAPFERVETAPIPTHEEHVEEMKKRGRMADAAHATTAPHEATLRSLIGEDFETFLLRTLREKARLEKRETELLVDNTRYLDEARAAREELRFANAEIERLTAEKRAAFLAPPVSPSTDGASLPCPEEEDAAEVPMSNMEHEQARRRLFCDLFRAVESREEAAFAWARDVSGVDSEENVAKMDVFFRRQQELDALLAAAESAFRAYEGHRPMRNELRGSAARVASVAMSLCSAWRRRNEAFIAWTAEEDGGKSLLLFSQFDSARCVFDAWFKEAKRSYDHIMSFGSSTSTLASGT